MSSILKGMHSICIKKLCTNIPTSPNNFRVITDMKMSAKKSVWAAVLVLSKCLCFIICFTLFHGTDEKFKLELPRKGHAVIIYVSILFAEPEFSFTSGRETRLPATS